MTVQETKTQHIELTSQDIADAIVLYLKERGYREISATDVKLFPTDKKISATITIIQEVNSDK